jgi:hypothetical protein
MQPAGQPHLLADVLPDLSCIDAFHVTSHDDGRLTTDDRRLQSVVCGRSSVVGQTITRPPSIRDEERARGATLVCRDLTITTLTVFDDLAS